MLRRLIGTALLALWCPQTLAGEAISRAAAEYPARPIRIVVPSSTGGGIDTLARIFGPKMTDTWGKPIIIDNRQSSSTIAGWLPCCRLIHAWCRQVACLRIATPRRAIALVQGEPGDCDTV